MPEMDGKHVVSCGRDMSVKLTEVATMRFVDNVTSITPGALKGGVQVLARHPQRNEVLIGGTDGAPVRGFGLANVTIAHAAADLESSCIYGGCGQQSVSDAVLAAGAAVNAASQRFSALVRDVVAAW
jgi:hypothetical protein